MRKVKIMPNPARIKANPAYRVRVPHAPNRMLATDGELVDLTGDVARLLACGDVVIVKPQKKKRKASKKQGK